jgi:Transposase DDE domain group 1
MNSDKLCLRGQESHSRVWWRPAFFGRRADGGAAAGGGWSQARCIPDQRDPSRISHTIADMIRARVFAICCGYEDSDDPDVLRSDPTFSSGRGTLAAEAVAVRFEWSASRRAAAKVRAGGMGPMPIHTNV